MYNVVNILNATELYTSKCLLLCNVNITSIKKINKYLTLVKVKHRTCCIIKFDKIELYPAQYFNRAISLKALEMFLSCRIILYEK